MSDYFLTILDSFDELFWGYIGVPSLMLFGIYFSLTSRFFQIRSFPKIIRNFFHHLKAPASNTPGIPALEAFFASIGGCIGISNIVAVATAVQLGGPGAIVWMWIAAFFGMLVKYAEIYLGVRYRIPNDQNGYDGGPMIFLQKVFSSPWIPRIFCILLCIYGVEIYIFKIMTHTLVTSWSLNEYLVIATLLVLVLYGGMGGVHRVGEISTVIIPVFILLFCCMGTWILIQNITLLPQVLATIFSSALTGHAAVGGFAGSSLLTTISRGVQRACYTSDIGIGYASVIHSESAESQPGNQASLSIIGIFLDTFVICTLSTLLIVVTGVWKENIHEDMMVVTALGKYFPYIEYIWPLFIFLLGYSSLLAFFAVGRKAALFLSPRYGAQLFYLYATCSFLFFSFVGEPHHSLTVMTITAIFLLILNLIGMFKLRNAIVFELE